MTLVSFIKKTWKNGVDPTLDKSADPDLQASEMNRIENGINDTANAVNSLSDSLSAEASTRATADTSEATARASADNAHAALTTDAHGGIVAADDARLVDARTPIAHAGSHLGGSDDMLASLVETFDERYMPQTVTVAPHDSTRTSGVDLILTGADDDVALQQLIDGLTAPTRLQILDGTVVFGGPVTVKSGLHVWGLGRGVTTLAGDPGAENAFFDLSQSSGDTLADVEFHELTIDARDQTQRATSGETPNLGMIRDTGAGSVTDLIVVRCGFLGGTQWNISPVCAYSDTGQNARWRIVDCYALLDGNRVYCFQVRKATAGVWVQRNYIDVTGASGVAPYNAIAVYGGSTDVHIDENTIVSQAPGAHSPIALSPSGIGSVIGNVVHGPTDGEAGIEIQSKGGHGGDTVGPADVVVMGNVVNGAYDGIVVNDESPAVGQPEPSSILIVGNVLKGCTRAGVHLVKGTNICEFANAFDGCATNVLVESTVTVGAVSATSPLAGIVSMLGGGVSKAQTITITGSPTGGTFTLTYNGATTAALAYNSTAAQVQAALEALGTLGAGSVVCTGGQLPASPVVVTFAGALAYQQTSASVVLGTNSLTGGTTPAVAVTTTTNPVPATPTAAEAQVVGGHLLLPNGASVKFGNAAGTNWQPVLTRDKNNAVILRGGDGIPFVFVDTSGRIGIGHGNINPNGVDGNIGAIVLANAIPGGVTRVTVKAGDTQGTTELMRFVDASGTELSFIGPAGLLYGGSLYVEGANKTTITDADFPVTPKDGMRAVCYDTTAGKAYEFMRAHGGWIKVVGPL